ncbi:MAG: glycerophosphodiester phosphodiesterase family protein [Gammaproteobacteria bacterium]|nr:glycerophosphodiester phosphodiesterase family protein [Gammaproteobacteria bacterium]
MLPQTTREPAAAACAAQAAKGLLIIGHRGAAGLFPENTLAGFAGAVELGVDGVELDVRMAGSEVVVIHDERVDRTTNGTGMVSELGFTELRSLDAGDRQRIPTLAEVLELVPKHVMVNVELKGSGTALPVAGIVGDLAGVVQTTGLPSLLVSSFDYDELRRFREVCPGVPCAPLAGRWSDNLEAVVGALDAWSVNLSQRTATQAHVRAVRSWGRRCLVFTVNDPDRAKVLSAMGVAGVFTDYPDRLVADPVSCFSSSASSRCSS